ncbi:MAG: hypothetical protein ACO1QS_03170 [Verrucomicrobiota bacterium]
MRITYQLAGSGWANALVSEGERTLEMSASYLSDALGDMAKAAVSLLTEAREVTFSFQDEPGEHQWILTRGEFDALHVRVVWFPKTFGSGNKAGSGIEVFACDCTVMDFVGQVFSTLNAVLHDEGLEGYKRRWKNNDFPLKAYQELQKLLA